MGCPNLHARTDNGQARDILPGVSGDHGETEILESWKLGNVVAPTGAD
jgi:hypothetical protein